MELSEMKAGVGVYDFELIKKHVREIGQKLDVKPLLLRDGVAHEQNEGGSDATVGRFVLRVNQDLQERIVFETLGCVRADGSGFGASTFMMRLKDAADELPGSGVRRKSAVLGQDVFGD